MKILILSDPFSVHTVKWVNSLSKLGHDIYLFGLGSGNPVINHKVTQLNFGEEASRNGLFKKIGYFKALPFLKEKVKEIQPDIVHSHFATSYGALGMLLNHNRFLISIWGSDVFDFPKKSFLHKFYLKKVLASACRIFSTSETMKLEGKKYTEKDIFVTPFGVDQSQFRPAFVSSKDYSKKQVSLGVIKALEDKYGIDILIESFAQVIKQISVDLSLHIVGKGSRMDDLIELTQKLGLTKRVKFYGQVSQEEVISLHNDFDLEIFPSILDSESFGVSVVEAMACGTPVIVSDVSGFKEVINYGECGLIVKRGDVNALAIGILKLIENKPLREEYISKGLNRVQQYYNWESNVDLMVKHYEEVLAS
ncbi:glycosyltransferase [Litoribacter alkaliphilus]|uniref:Glycosyltransferase n=1 Tax=Litoribacter ruber TaxID=702568 RepID=A0AAP2G2F7_9BACT|nr:glycosyltransferase [Litoribacter alkaliphilus]MBS9525697.1 glycosyltransferase [Litoribacter alkaliphilus]